MPQNKNPRPVGRVARLLREVVQGPAKDWDAAVDDVMRRVCVDRDARVDGRRDSPQYPGGNPRFNERGPSRTEVRRNKVWAGGSPDFDERRSA
jgi:hypothetical protein